MAAHDEARRLLAKAAEDEYVLGSLLPDPAAPDSMIGFHAQQAAEKILKAALFLAGAEPPRTHNLAALLDLARDSKVRLPHDAGELRWLTPYAVLYRYDAGPADDDVPLDREKVAGQIRSLRAWLERRLETKTAKKHGPC